MALKFKNSSIVLSLITTLLLIVTSYVTKAQIPSLTISVTTDRTEYFEKEPIVVSITVKNQSPQPITLNFNSGYQADYVIDDSYRWSNDKAFIQTLTEVVLPSFGAKTWKLVHNSKVSPLPVGPHKIRGEVVKYGNKETMISVVSAPKFVVGIHPLNGKSDRQFVATITDRPTISKTRECLVYSQNHPDDPRCGWLVAGKIGINNGGFNLQGDGSLWNWHLIPDTVKIVESAIELCDGVPNDVKSSVPVTSFANGTFCPWGSYIISEKKIDALFSPTLFMRTQSIQTQSTKPLAQTQSRSNRFMREKLKQLKQPCN